MGRKQSRGACIYCGKKLTKAGMTKHLATCPQWQEAIATAEAKKGKRYSGSTIALQIKDNFLPAPLL